MILYLCCIVKPYLIGSIECDAKESHVMVSCAVVAVVDSYRI